MSLQYQYTVLQCPEGNGLGDDNIQFIPDDYFELVLQKASEWHKGNIAGIQIIDRAVDLARKSSDHFELRHEPCVYPVYDWQAHEQAGMPTQLVVFVKFDNNGTTVKVLVSGDIWELPEVFKC